MFNANFWEEKYQANTTGWDIGYPSTPLIEYIKQLKKKEISILIPGCGRAYEAEFLFDNGFSNFKILDFAPSAFKALKERRPDIPDHHFIFDDLFLHQGKYDLILEQTFFCAIKPETRENYVEKMESLLNENGKIAGVLFIFPLTNEGPPFGGSELEYQQLFSKKFNLHTLKPCENSIKPRQGKEVFFIFQKK